MVLIIIVQVYSQYVLGSTLSYFNFFAKTDEQLWVTNHLAVGACPDYSSTNSQPGRLTVLNGVFETKNCM